MGSSLKILGCLCTCLLVAVNNIAIIIGAIFLAIGIVITFGIGWITQNESVAEILKKASDLLKDYIHADVDIMELAKNLSSLTGSVGATFIVIGVAIILLSCVGCLGGCCKIKPCLIIYAATVALFFLAQLTVVILWYADSNILKSAAKGAMENSVRKYTGINSANVESLMQNVVQIYAGCCGVNNGTDFHTLNDDWDRRYTMVHAGRNYTFNLTYPVTCCQFNYATLQPWDAFCPYNNTIRSNHMKGCYSELFYYIDTYFLNILFFILSGILGLQLLLISGAVVIYTAENNENNRIKPY